MNVWLTFERQHFKKNIPTKLFISKPACSPPCLSPLSPVISYPMSFSSVFAGPMFPFHTTTLALCEPVPALENKKFCCFLLVCLAKPASHLSPNMLYYPNASDSVSTEAAHEVEPTILSLYSNSF